MTVRDLGACRRVRSTFGSGGPARARSLALSVALLLAAACAAGDGAATTTALPTTALPTSMLPATSAPATTTPASGAPAATPPTAAATTTTAAAATTTPAVTATPDARAVLDAALASLDGGYHFSTSATVAGHPALSAEGDHVGDGTRMTVTSGGAAVDYVVTPAGTWVNDAGQWREVATSAPVADPLAPLRAPDTAQIVASTPEATTIHAVYPAAALALAGDSITVEFVVAGGTVTSVTYTADPTGRPATVTAAIGPVADPTPISPPV